MVFIKIGVLLFVLSINQSLCSPGHHHVHHRIHVPTKIKTVYHTKIIKIPEHHHYVHEKEKPHLVKVPEHHHYFHEKEKEKEPLLDLHDYHPRDDEENFQSDFEDEYKGSYGHNIHKKHAPTRRYKKRKY